jgi:hypothetical protein
VKNGAPQRLKVALKTASYRSIEAASKNFS